MSHYRHLTIEEREKLYLLFNQGVSIRKIAAALNRSPSTIRIEENVVVKSASLPMPKLKRKSEL